MKNEEKYTNQKKFLSLVMTPQPLLFIKL